MDVPVTGAPHEPQLTALAVEVARWLEAAPSPDLALPNALAGRLRALAADLHATLESGDTAPSCDLADIGACLQRVVALQDGVREAVMVNRFHLLEQIREGLTRLRAAASTGELVASGADELGRCCRFDRTVVAGVRGSSWRAESVWRRDGLDDPPVLDLVDGWTHLSGGPLETDLVRRKLPLLVRSDGRRPHGTVMTGWTCVDFVAAPVVVDQRVAGFLYADSPADGRDLTTLDRDNVAAFAEGFGLVFERAALLERLERQRLRVQDVLLTTERDLGGLDDVDTVLVRRDRASVAGVRMAAGLRKIAISPLEQLLTIRERQVLDLMVEGARNRQIADQLVVSEETVKSHVRSISRKLHASSRADAVSRYLHLRIREQA